MGISLTIMDLDKDFANQTIPPVIINDIDDTDKVQSQMFSDMIYTVFDGEVMDNIISCDCGSITTQMNLGAYCNNCRSYARRRNEPTIDALLWLRRPKGCPPMINPKVLHELDLNIVVSGFTPIRYLVDTQYRPKLNSNASILIDWMREQGFERGYKFFYENYDRIVESLCNHKFFRVKGKDVLLFCKLYREVTFVEYIPLPNKSLLIIEENSTGIYRERSIENAIDACRTVVGIDLDVKGYTQKMRENRMIKAIYLLNDFVSQYIKNNIKGKGGAIRKHMIAARTYWTCRAVISSLTGQHDYDEIHIPWGVGIGILRLHLANKLHRLGMTPREAINFLNEHAAIYHPLIDRLFKEIIDEAKPHKGLPALFCRNPSLLRGSIVRFFITKVKSDPSDVTQSISILAVRSLNADFDGDQTSMALCVDEWMADKAYAFAPHQNVMDSGNYRKLTDCFAVTKPFALNVGNWFRNQNMERTAEQEDFLKELVQ